MTYYHAWNMVTDEIKFFRFEHSRDIFLDEAKDARGYTEWTDFDPEKEKK